MIWLSWGSGLVLQGVDVVGGQLRVSQRFLGVVPAVLGALDEVVDVVQAVAEVDEAGGDGELLEHLVLLCWGLLLETKYYLRKTESPCRALRGC